MTANDGMRIGIVNDVPKKVFFFSFLSPMYLRVFGAKWDVFTPAVLEEPAVFFVRLSLCVRVCVVAIACRSDLCIESRKTTGTVLAQAIRASRDSALCVCSSSIFFTQVLVQLWASA